MHRAFTAGLLFVLHKMGWAGINGRSDAEIFLNYEYNGRLENSSDLERVIRTSTLCISFFYLLSTTLLFYDIPKMTYLDLCDFKIIKYQNLKCESDFYSSYNKFKNLFENGFCEEVVFYATSKKYKFIFRDNTNIKFF